MFWRTDGAMFNILAMAKISDTDLKLLRDKIIVFNKFKVEKGLIPKELLALIEQTNLLVEKAYQDKFTRALKEASNDINEQVRHMPLSLAIELKRLFKNELNIDFDVVDKLRLKEIEKILKIGKVLTDEQYRLLEDRVDEIYTDADKVNELNQINSVLLTYHK